ncbi:gp436 family protein [Alysiella crassa]|uniref:Mu-like prophage protein gp36 n=1 Tax=Alysiella crassa TaxID=153491 RepID=A0A376BUK3_9NEIS|nr:DUF1320 domain-containing protein [Alysiella crassa]UOP06163.1 DUF1320 domain-containing protein [Alysiella crassa]SSY80636.1 Mu-like prophage protein gp36 [Alysiella crassa]
MISGSLITQADLEKRFGKHELAKLTTRPHDKDITPADVLQKAIEDAESEANGYLRAAGFVEPFAVVPATLKVKVCDIARWYLYENGVNTIVETRYKNAIGWLKDVMKNPSMLGFDAEGVEEAKVSGGIAVIPNEPEEWRDVKGLF